jgi:hypothetical protein
MIAKILAREVLNDNHLYTPSPLGEGWEGGFKRIDIK